jgi:hypothetical protein
LASIKITFTINLLYNGPIFYNWIPAERDHLILKTPEPDTFLKVWFEPSEQVDLTKLQDNRVRASMFKGILQIDNVSSDILNIFEENKTKFTPYEEFGKKVIKRIINPTVTRFFMILKIIYGQFWIFQPQAWDSLQMSLGRYCEELRMEWSVDGKKWCCITIAEEAIRSTNGD